VAALLGIYEGIKALRERRFGVGIEGYEPSFFLTGRVAMILISLLIVGCGILAVRPELLAGD
jgi:hypothetical protein